MHDNITPQKNANKIIIKQLVQKQHKQKKKKRKKRREKEIKNTILAAQPILRTPNAT